MRFDIFDLIIEQLLKLLDIKISYNWKYAYFVIYTNFRVMRAKYASEAICTFN